MDGNPTITLRRIESNKIKLIPKSGYYKLKYIDEFTILSIILTCSDVRMECSGNHLIIRITDEWAIYSLSQIDQTLYHSIKPVKPILNKDKSGYFIALNQNPILLAMYKRAPTHIYIHVKTIRQSNDLNIPILYILDR
jgi:hypothetical protein